MANANQVIVNGETILDLRSDTVTPETLQKGYTAHDKSGTKITGTLEASSPGAAKETWVLNSAADHPGSDQDAVIFNVDFTSNGLSFSSIVLSTNLRTQIVYDSTTVKMLGRWASEAYRKLTFDTPPTGALLTWLQANGVKQPDDTAIQDTKAVTITSNGTVSVTPDVPYDAVKEVNVTVDVASGGGGAGFKVTFPATAPNWKPDDSSTAAFLWLSDGTLISMGDYNYSNVAGKTFDGVIGLYVENTYSSYVPRITLMGSVIVNGISAAFGITTDGVTPARFAMPKNLIFLFLSDATISSIEIYKTD